MSPKLAELDELIGAFTCILKPPRSVSPLFPDTASLFSGLVFPCWYFMITVRTNCCADRRHAELTGFLWLCQSGECLPKKDAASWGPHFGTFPSDPSLKAPAAAEEIRGWKTLDGITTGEHRSGTDWSGSTQRGSTLVDPKLLMTPYVPGSRSSLFLVPGLLLESTPRELF